MTHITIADTHVARGERRRVDIPVAWLPSQAMLSMPVSVFCGEKDGPRLWISSAVHGDEINGVEVIRRVLAYLKKRRINGTLMAVPIVNVFGFTQQSRYLPDRRDLNRSFPGSPTGSLAGRVANLFLKEIVERSTHGIDIHTGAVHRGNALHIRCDTACAESLELAKAFQPPIILTSKSMAGTLRAAATKLDIANINVEMGEALRFDEADIEACTEGILRVMNHLGMIEGYRVAGCPEPQFSEKTVWVRAKHSGLFHTDVNLGDTVKKSSVLGRISDALGGFNTRIISPKTGVVIGLTKNPLVYQGDALMHIALVDD